MGDEDPDDVTEYRSATSSADSHMETHPDSGDGGGTGAAGAAGLVGGTEAYARLRTGASLDPRRQRRYFTLRVETCSSGTGKFLGVLFWMFMIAFILYGTAVIVLGSLDGSSTVTQVSDSYYFVNMIILSSALGLVVCMAGVFAYRLYSALARGGRTWRKRQPYLIRDAVVVSTLTTVDLCCVVTSYALYVAAECFPSETALVVLSFMRMVTFTATVAWMTTTATLMQLVNDDQDGHGEDGEHQMGRSRGVTGSQGPGNAQVDASTTSVTVRTADICRVGHTRNVRLLVDEPVSVILRKRWYVGAVYLIFAVLSIVILALRVAAVDRGLNNIPPKMSCDPDQLEPYVCSDNTVSDIIAYAVLATVYLFLWACYIFSVRFAWSSQKDLPSARFRISKLFLRIQMRYGRLMFFSIIFTGLVVELATMGSCRGRITALLGSPAAHLSLAVYACTLLFLFAPGSEIKESVTMFKSIAWREDDVRCLLDELKACQEDRYVLLATERLMFVMMIVLRIGDTDVFEYLQKQLGIGRLSKLVNLQERAGGSVFCMEYAVKMFYYSWSAYKRSARTAFAAAGDASYPFSAEKGMRAFPGIRSSKEFIDEETDTYGIMYWSDDSIVLSFRGTASGKNVVTDLKATTVRYEPCKYLYGFPVLVHNGFWKAWSTVRERVIGEVLALAKGGGVERVFVTGHSLGGALACLCSVELQAEFNRRRPHAGGDDKGDGCPVTGILGNLIPGPSHDLEGQLSPELGKIEVHTYTFGAPRVGNVGFGAYANMLLSNYWHVVNTEDPVARIPKGPSYARSGHRVLLGRNGNLEIYPSHFESSLFTSVGGKFSDHMMRTYATRLGQFMKAQFVPDLTGCDSEAELNVVRQMVRKLETESLGLGGLLCCSLGELEDGDFELSLLPNSGASAPSSGEVAKRAQRAKVTNRASERRWLARLLPGRSASRPGDGSAPSAGDPELGRDSQQHEADEESEDEMDLDFEEGLDDKVLQVLKGVWGD